MASNLYVTGPHVYGAPGGTTVPTSADGFQGVLQGQIIVVSDACAEGELRDHKTGELLFDAETVHNVNLETLRGEFCDVMSSAEVIKLLNKDAS